MTFYNVYCIVVVDWKSAAEKIGYIQSLICMKKIFRAIKLILGVSP